MSSSLSQSMGLLVLVFQGKQKGSCWFRWQGLISKLHGEEWRNRRLCTVPGPAVWSGGHSSGLALDLWCPWRPSAALEAAPLRASVRTPERLHMMLTFPPQSLPPSLLLPLVDTSPLSFSWKHGCWCHLMTSADAWLLPTVFTVGVSPLWFCCPLQSLCFALKHFDSVTPYCPFLSWVPGMFLVFSFFLYG